MEKSLPSSVIIFRLGSIFFHTLCKLPVNLTAILALPFCSFSPTSITLPFSTSCNTMSRLLNVILPIETGYILPPALCYHFLPFYLSLQLEQYHLAFQSVRPSLNSALCHLRYKLLE